MEAEVSSTQGALSDLERRVRSLTLTPSDPALRQETLASRDAPPEDGGPRLLPRGADPEVIARAVRDLQSRVTEQESRVEGMAAEVREARTPRNRFHFKPPIRTIEEAQRRLDLSGPQRADIERILDYARRDLEDLRNLPNAEGKTYKDVQASTTTSGDGAFTMVMTNMAEVQKWRASQVPGSSETYGEAEKRIRTRTDREVRDVLSPKQQETWDESSTQGLLGPSTTASVFKISTAETQTTR